MISKLKGGILSCIGLIIINILRGIIHIPHLELDNFIIYTLILQLGYLWFTLSLWIVLKYDLVKLNDLEDLIKPLDWLIRNLAIFSGAGILSTFFPSSELSIIVALVGIVLFINYIFVFVQFYRLNKHELEFAGDLHNYVISMIVLIIVGIIVNTLSEFVWYKDYNFLFDFLSSIPILFFMRFLIREKHDIEKKVSGYSIN